MMLLSSTISELALNAELQRNLWTPMGYQVQATLVVLGSAGFQSAPPTGSGSVHEKGLNSNMDRKLTETCMSAAGRAT